MYFCGLRLGEALNLRWDGINIDFENKKITVTNRPASKEIPPFKIKDYEDRSLPMPKQVIDILTKLKEQQEEGNPFVFLSNDRYQIVKKKWQKDFYNVGKAGDWVNRNLANNILRDFKQHCRDAGIKINEKYNLHGLRKSFACNLANFNTPIQCLLKLMGHSKLQTCQEFYLKSCDSNEKRAVEQLEKMCEGQG
jgi:integrase